MQILIDNGHGQTTPGKRTPDDCVLQSKFNHIIIRQFVAILQPLGHDASLLS